MPGEIIAPAHVRYIKLGDGGRWFKDALSQGTLLFGYRTVDHDACLRGDWEAVRHSLADRGSDSSRSSGVTEVRAFYELGADCLWITFGDGHLWWTFAEPEVRWLRQQHENSPSRTRLTPAGWNKTDVNGRPLRVHDLSSKLTRTAGYRGTICTVSEQEYLLRRINGVEEPIARKAREARAAMIEVAIAMIRSLHWADFETLTDLIFARSGWQRSTPVGENLTDIDLVMEQPTTGETAFVQVKSQAGQQVLEDYLSRFRGSGYDRFFFVCHSPKGRLTLPDEPRLHLFAGERLADVAVRNGLFDWLIERSS